MIEAVRGNPFLGLLLLVVLHLFLLSVQIRSEAGTVLLRSWGLAVLGPVALTADQLSGGVRNLVTRWRLLHGLEARNRYLEEENWRLQTELHQLEAMRRLVERDASFRLLAERHTFDTVRAAVIWRNVPLYSEKVVINAGLRHGVRKDAAVIMPEGAVGRVLAVTAWTSEVELLTDVNAAAGAVLGDSRLQGVVQGTGGALLALNFVPATEEVGPGEVVYTSGADGIYPKGIPIGAVASAARDGGVYLSVLVEPFVEFPRLEEVAVVLVLSEP
jgi:rod shape-determining protein MreC